MYNFTHKNAYDVECEIKSEFKPPPSPQANKILDPIY